jgi:hypothetical protein
MDKYIDQWERTENLWSIDFQEGYQDHSIGKGQSSNKRCWGSWIFTCKRTKLDTYLKSYTKIKSKWIKDLKV